MATQSKQKKVKVGRPKLKVFRSSEPLKSVLMWGINYSHNALQHVRPHAVFIRDDFKSFIKIKVNNHNFDRENMPSKYKFKEYSPMVFQSLRKKFNISNDHYMEAFTQCEPEWDLTVGRSGSKFLVTYNRNFVVKIINSEDLIQMHSILENYYAYIVQCSGDTYLPHYLGLYRIRVSDADTYLLVMRNVFSPRLAIHSRYDLKGTHVDREANDKEKNKPIPTLKDMDFINELSSINIGPESKTELMTKLRRDIQFLQDNNLTDYSVLVGVHDLDHQEQFVPPKEISETDEQQQGYASAGDGMGEIIEMLKRRGIPAMRQSGPTSIGFPGLPGNAQNNVGAREGERRSSGAKMYLSSRSQTTDEDEEMLSDTRPEGLEQETITAQSAPVACMRRTMDQDQDMMVSSPEQMKGAGLGHLTPPESPPSSNILPESVFNGVINKKTEFFGVASSPNAKVHCIYFIGLIDILNQYGFKKRTAKTYKSVTGHNADVSNVKPEQYGSRLLEFINTHMV